MLDCTCGEKIPDHKLRKHLKEDHQTQVIKAFMTTHFKNRARVPDSWECMKCRHSKNKETDFISEESCIQHIKDEHLNEAVDEFADGLK